MEGSPAMLLRDIEQFIRAHDVPPTRFGREAVGDPRFVFDLRNGREPREATCDRVRAYLGQAEGEAQAGRPPVRSWRGGARRRAHGGAGHPAGP